MEITTELVRRLFDYDPTEPFALRWKERPWRTKVVVGSIAGYWHPVRAKCPILMRYVNAGPKNRALVHRVVWLHVTGEHPPKILRFKDGDSGDCRIENLVAGGPALTVEAYRERRKKMARERCADPEAETKWIKLVRSRNLLRYYGISIEDYDRMHAQQEGLCAICHQPETLKRHGKVEDLVVDHCHGSDKVRGLLCHNCNNGIGRFKDDPAALRRAADYIEHHQEQHFSGPHP